MEIVEKRLEKVQQSSRGCKRSVLVSGIVYTNKLVVKVHWFIYMIYVFVNTLIF